MPSLTPAGFVRATDPTHQSVRRFRRLNILAAIFSLVGQTSAHADYESGLVELDPGTRLYVEHRPARNGRPTLVLANGLTYATKEWDAFSRALLKLDPELGLVRYDMRGQGRTLRASGGQRERLPIQTQVDDLKRLVAKLEIKGPKSLLGLSYGGAVALETLAQSPDLFGHVIAMSSYLEPMPAQDEWVAKMIRWSRLVTPFDMRSDDELYDWYLRALVYGTYPVAEPIAAENYPYKLEAIFRMAQGIRGWSVGERIAKLVPRRLHVVASADDQYVTLDRMQCFVSQLPAGIASSVAVWNKSGHKLVEERPELAAAYIHQILIDNPVFARGLTFTVDPFTGVASSRNGEIRINLRSDCESSLR